jgi:hypothetical protein
MRRAAFYGAGTVDATNQSTTACKALIRLSRFARASW